MKLSKKTDYALRVLFSLVESWGKGPVSILDLAQKNNIPKKFLEHILLDLKKQGWVDSLPGRNGGYLLAQDPDRITMGEIIRYFDGLMAPISCVSVCRYETCGQEAVCKFRRVFSGNSQLCGSVHGRSHSGQGFLR